jgi:PadR family transcriptional regulator PadR
MEKNEAGYHGRRHRAAGFIWLFMIWRLSKEPMYGYSMIDEVQNLGIGAYQPSTIYSVLAKLEKAGFIKGKKVEVGGRLRRMYETTAEGKKLLKRIKENKVKGLMREFIESLLH